ncbi:uncharacterized protein LOC116164372 [Photinus pyralis]|uniref:uncharacterized protein LOC116164372 n=1 Tax=Photinus pyralis TaxID=7054 RepID=UPI0012670AA9|nr:uncharacterized protein LOC116164372 [Photinus pyralis]
MPCIRRLINYQLFQQQEFKNVSTSDEPTDLINDCTEAAVYGSCSINKADEDPFNKSSEFLQLKEETEVQGPSNVKILQNIVSLVNERWKFDMGSLALKDLNEKHSSKPKTLPITSDIIKFRDYTTSVADQSMAVLKENIRDQISFKKLTEASLVLTILLNRKRVGDVQYIKLNTYLENQSSDEQEECMKALSESEKMLCKHFKRIVTIGKGSKCVPILFPKNGQTYIDTLLDARRGNDLIPKENPYLFAAIGTKDKWVNASQILRKYSENCGAANPGTLRSSRLRKQIATVLQILHLNESEKEQVASFMGHTKKTHEEYYRLPQDVYQTAKISKLLLIMEKGEGADHQGKSLQEIDVELEAMNDDCKQSDDEGENDAEPQVPENDIEDTKINEEPEIVIRDKIRNVTVTNKGSEGNKRGKWNTIQKNIMKDVFKKHIKNKIPPKKHECMKLKDDHKELFEQKTWVQIKVFVYNTFKFKKE